MQEYLLLEGNTGGNCGVNIPKNTWHTIRCDEPCVLFECKEGPFVEQEKEGVLEMEEVRC